METNITKADHASQEIIQKLVLDGDLSKMSAPQKVEYYNKFCLSLGLNPLTQPFQLVTFQGKQRLYAMKDCAEQLRKIHGVSITDVNAIELKGVYVVTAKAVDKDGKTDASTGVVNIEGLKGESLANALMKAETKAKRRVTLSICGLGVLDESELDTMKGAETKPVQTEDIPHSVVTTPAIAAPTAEKPNQSTDNDDIMLDWKQALATCKTIDDLGTFYTSNLEAVNTYPDVQKLFDAREKEIKAEVSKAQKPWLNQDSKMYEKVVSRLKNRTTTIDEVSQHFQMSKIVRGALETIVNSVVAGSN